MALKLLCRMLSGPLLGALCDTHGRTLALTALHKQYAKMHTGKITGIVSRWTTAFP